MLGRNLSLAASVAQHPNTSKSNEYRFGLVRYTRLSIDDDSSQRPSAALRCRCDRRRVRCVGAPY